MLSFAMSVFLSLLPINLNVAFASVESQSEPMFIEGAEEAFETLSEQEFPTLMSQETEDKGELSRFSSLETESEGEFSAPGSQDTEEEEEFSKANKEDMLAESPTEYKVLVKDIRVNSDNKDDVLGDGGSVKYVPATGDQRARLTLNNLRVEDDTSGVSGEDYRFIVAYEDIDLILKGDNVINITAAEGDHTDDLRTIGGILGKRIYCDGEGESSLSIDINAETKLKQLCGLYGIRNNNVGSLSNTTINIDSYVGYNTNLVRYHKISIMSGIWNTGSYLNINASNINLDINIKSREDFKHGIGWFGVYSDNVVNISGDSSLSTKSITNAIQTKELNIKGKYKIDMEGYIRLRDSANVGINFEDISPGSYFIVRDKGSDEVLNCHSSVSEGTAKFSVPDKVVVLAGDSEENAKPIAKDELNNLYYYDSNPSAYPNIKYVKVVYKSNISFNAGSGLGSMTDAECMEGDKYILPECSFIPVAGKQFKAWEIGGMHYAPGTEIVVEGDIVVKAIYKSNISFNADSGSGSMADVECMEGDKYTLPECTFTPPTGKQFKAWKVAGTHYASGTEVVIEGDTVVTAVWEDKPSESGSGSGSGSSDSGSGDTGGGSGGGSGGGGSSGDSGSGGGGSGGSSRSGLAKGGAQKPAKQSGSWMQDSSGWWYKNADGSYPNGIWQQIDSVWYAFNDAGYMVTGWYSVGGSWYYLNTSGVMSTGWVEVSGKWYYFNTSGAMSTAWIEVNGKWYYLEPAGREGKPQGSLYISENTPDGYPVNELGEWVR